ncbi:hypothetical protein [Streptomyces sp. NPDC050145]|uniref:hypothetical protein n=1 Tax=Streptomyces sp. NPDC050145 TaxID=3365602 RepID=UPI0037B2B65F
MASPVHPHPATAHGPADTGLALAVAAALNPPATRAPELVPTTTKTKAKTKTQAQAKAARRAARERRAAVRG